MKFTIALAVAVVLSFLTVGAAAKVSEAQAGQVLEACERSQSEILAGELPSEVSIDKCPVGDRPIVDNGVEAVLPEAGEGVYAEVLTTDGSQELVLARHNDGTVELNKVGDEAETSAAEEAEATFSAAGSGSNPCRDRAYSLTSWKVYDQLAYRYNYRTTPRYLNRRSTGRAIRRAGVNVANNQNSCRIGDRVEARLTFQGGTRRTAGVRSDGSCATSDGRSVVSFGGLSGSSLAVTCT